MLQVHDELCMSVKDKKEAETIAKIMINAVVLEVPSKCDVEVGPSWGEALQDGFQRTAHRAPLLTKGGTPPSVAFFLVSSHKLLYALCENAKKVRSMDTTKWKSVLVPIEVYKEIKEHSVINGRTISGQLRIMFDVYLQNKDKTLDVSHKVAYKQRRHSPNVSIVKTLGRVS